MITAGVEAGQVLGLDRVRGGETVDDLLGTGHHHRHSHQTRAQDTPHARYLLNIVFISQV